MKLNKKGEGLRPYTMSIVMVVLFTFFILAFVSDFLTTTNPNSEVLGSSYALNQSLNNLDSSLANFTNLSENVFRQLQEDEPTAIDYLFLIFKGAYYIPVTIAEFFYLTATSITNLLFVSLAGTGLGKITSLGIGALLASLLITIVFLIVKAIRTGESER